MRPHALTEKCAAQHSFTATAQFHASLSSLHTIVCVYASQNNHNLEIHVFAEVGGSLNHQKTAVKRLLSYIRTTGSLFVTLYA